MHFLWDYETSWVFVTDNWSLSQANVIPMLGVWGLSNAFLMGLPDFLGLCSRPCAIVIGTQW